MAAIEEFITTYKNSGTKRNYRSGIQKFLAWKYSFQISGTKATFEERKKFDLLADDYITRDQNYSKDIVDFISNCDNHDIPAKSIRRPISINFRSYILHRKRLKINSMLHCIPSSSDTKRYQKKSKSISEKPLMIISGSMHSFPRSFLS